MKPEQIDTTKQNVATDADNNSNSVSNNKTSNETSKQESEHNLPKREVSSQENLNESESVEATQINDDSNLEDNQEEKDNQTSNINLNEPTFVEGNNDTKTVNTSGLDTSFENTETQLNNTNDNTEKEKALTNFVAENTGNSIEEASENVENLNIDYNQVDNKALLSALIKADSNKKDAEATYATTSDVNTTRSVQPKSRLTVNKLVAARQGQNVNDLIKVSNQYIEEGHNNDGVIHAHDGERITYHSDIAFDDAVNSGDTMTIDYDPHTIPSDLTDEYFVPAIADSNGDIIATGTYDNATKRATYTFTDFVDTHSNVKGTLSLSSFIDKSKVPTRDTNIDMTFKTVNTAYNQNFTVDYQYPRVKGDSNIQSIFTHLDLDNQTVEQTVYVNPLRYTAKNTDATINGNGPNGSTIIDNNTEIKIYKVASDQYLPDSNRIYNYFQYEDVTNEYPVTINNNNTATINFGDINTPYIIKVVSKYQPDAEGNVNVEQWASMVTSNKYYGTDDTTEYGNNITFVTSNGNGNGDDTDSDADADADADADSDADADADSDNSELPETGNNEQKNGVLFGTLIAGIASLVLGRKRNKKNN
ncbi:fibrinogen-binding adhesin SdrG C-terminal domain-containing protein [Staphylococcus haemolyticus]|uniref:fibrinogen-binding adhesin SdrG C-terminal domain-containing protein n=3 Tax=Staphylococcus haemolyticus TaxID=1283 RepID=UPI000A100640|nr:fibrinogen-binding adhesin SdrG C-terminal domain-containing protein [Staphylococcus haemolyticus]